MTLLIEEIGPRMRAFRIGCGLTPEELAAETGVSRAAIYRYESGHPPKVDTLAKIAERLGVSLPNLLGVGIEYIASAVSFFERMRQLEEQSEQICVLFGPVSYLLTTDEFDFYLPKVLEESVPGDVVNRTNALSDIERVMAILRQRKEHYRARRPSLVCLVSLVELEQFCRTGFIGAYDPPGVDVERRKLVARAEVENIIRMLRDQPIGTQIGVLVDSMPGASFQLFRRSHSTEVGVSPYRLGSFANLRIGVATISAAPEAIDLYGDVMDRLWRRSVKGEDAARIIERRILDLKL